MSSDEERIDNETDAVVLPSDTLAILNEFLKNKQDQESLEFNGPDKQDMFEEDWQLSQFWYNESTKRTFSKICLRLILNRSGTQSSSDIKIALLSCPSLYKTIKSVHPNGEVRLFEYDKRFSAFKDDFVHYDYSDAEKTEYLNEFQNCFDIIIADPPFLSEECIRNTSLIVEKLKKADADVVMCSGQTVADWVKEFLHLNQCAFRPEHERNLANEFCSYANFDLDAFL